MGDSYKIYIIFKWQLGILISFKEECRMKFIILKIPFISCYFCLSQDAHGYYIFGKEIE
jgi:hypothetical protein